MKGIILSHGVVHEIDLPKWELEDMQEVVDGSIENCYCNEDLHYDMYCNEEGKLDGLYYHLALSRNSEIYDLVCGNILVIGFNDEGETVGLTQEAINDFRSRFMTSGALMKESKEVVSLFNTNDKIRTKEMELSR